MFASLPALALAALGQPPATPPVGGPQLAAACAGRDGWSDPAPPARIIGNTYYVGTCGISAILIVDPEGHVLVDGATAEAAPLIVASIRRLGFDPRQVRYLLTSHEHVDHAGGLAILKRLTGARLVARAAARAGLESGSTDAADPQVGTISDFEGVAVDRIVADGGTLRIGGVVITAHATPGHTAGGTSWSWRPCARAQACPTIVYADSLSAVGPDRYRFADHPARVAPFRTTFAKLTALRCDILITPHPSASNLFARLAGQAALGDPGACRAYVETARQRLDARIAGEQAAR